MRGQREVSDLVQNLVDHRLLLLGADVVLALVEVPDVLVDEVPQLTLVRIVVRVELVARELLVAVVVHPFAEMVRQVETSVVVSTVLEVDQDHLLLQLLEVVLLGALVQLVVLTCTALLLAAEVVH